LPSPVEKTANNENNPGQDVDAGIHSQRGRMDNTAEVVQSTSTKTSAALKLVVAVARDELKAERRRALVDGHGTLGFPLLQLTDEDQAFAATCSIITLVTDAKGKPLISTRAQLSVLFLLEQLPRLEAISARRMNTPVYRRKAYKGVRSAWKQVQCDLAKVIAESVTGAEVCHRIAERIMEQVFANFKADTLVMLKGKRKSTGRSREHQKRFHGD
jgi:hypothetical protein